MSQATRQLKSNVLQRALSAFLVEPFINKYNVICIRVLWRNGEEIWLGRRKVELMLENENSVVAFFSAVTLVKKSKSEEDDDDNNEHDDFGLAFWIVVDWPDYGILSIRTDLMKKVFDLNMDLKSCKAIRPRGKVLSMFNLKI